MNTIKERFFKYISPEPNSGCWLWTGSVGGVGYGQLSRTRKLGPATAHRVSYEIHNGPVGDKHVLHHCDVRSCCNPSHLYLGDNADNARDRKERGRAKGPSLKGADVHNAILSEAAVRDIRTQRISVKDFAAAYCVSVDAIRSVQKRKNWGHVDA